MSTLQDVALTALDITEFLLTDPPSRGLLLLLGVSLGSIFLML